LQKQRLRDELVAMAGGRIVHVRSADGMVLRLEWPILAVAEPDCANQASKSDLRQTLRVMLIGSQATQQFEMQQTLRQLFGKCEIGVTESVETALVQLDFGNFDLALIDLQSPGLDALELTRSIRSHAKPHVRALTVIGLGNAMLATQRQNYLDGGMQWVLFRPWTTDTLFRALSAQLR
jgi:CheY-like chemotaxis protein